MKKTLEQQLQDFIGPACAAGVPHDKIQEQVVKLFARYGREVPPPITGTMATIEPADRMES